MKHAIASAVIAVGSLLIVLILHSPLASIENQITSLKYAVRGEQNADSNIVLVYIDNDAIKDLGWPVRRNFYALMINALAELKAKAVGIDVLFENPNVEYPEYDRLLDHVVGDAHNVVLSSYFGKFVLNGYKLARVTTAPDSLGAFDYPLVSDVFRLGDDLHLPMPGLLHGAAGVGHVNVEDDGKLSLFVASDRLIIPSFGTEVLRVFCDAKRENLRFEHGVLSLRRDGKLLEIPSDDGMVALNYPGRISSFAAYPFFEVLRSYDALRAGRPPVVPVGRFKDKIVLVGVIAEGRTETFATPADPRFPSLGIHAVFLDNALRSGFLHATPSWVAYLIALLLGLGCAVTALRAKSPADVVAPLLAIVIAVGASFALFLLGGVLVPVMPFVITGGLSLISSLFYKHRFVREQLRAVLTEKELIILQLREREAKVAALEREVVSRETMKSEDRTNELLEEIRRYKAEIHTLSLRRDDMEEAVVADPALMSGMQSFDGIVYESGGAMQSVIGFVSKIAGSDAPVLILGESGTGKEMVARAIHKRSGRSAKAFIAVNCGALSENLLESELFGHERGAFTGAVKDRQGRFELADGGSILLDEIGEVSEAFQLKLLRVLQEGEFERVGGTKTLKVDVRVIAATNKDLKSLVQEKRFREDLYYRLNVLSIELPPLRERVTDIPLLVNHFLEKEGGGTTVSKNVLDTMQTYTWRGNIRELESAIRRAMLLAKADKRTMISLKDLPEEIAASARGSIPIEDQILESIREKGFSRNSVSETADELGGLNRGTVAEYLRGQCLKAFVEHAYDLETTVRFISLSADSAVNERVRKRIQEYLENIAGAVDLSLPWDTVKPALRPKTKNLPQRFHQYLEQAADAYYRRLWRTEQGPAA